MSHISHIIIVYTENKYQGRCTLTRKYTEIIICLSYISVETGHMALWIVQQKKKKKKVWRKGRSKRSTARKKVRTALRRKNHYSNLQTRNTACDE